MSEASTPRIPANEQVFVRVLFVDNRITIEINGAMVSNISGNGPFLTDVAIPVLQRGMNTIRVKGFNQAYGHNWHDPNPARISFSIHSRNLTNNEAIERFPAVTADGPDHRAHQEVEFYSGEFSFTVD